MSKIAFVLLSAFFSAFTVAAAPPSTPPEPVYIVLYSRFYDHSHPRVLDERLQRLLPLLEKLNARYPKSGISALCQFSGTTSEVLAEENSGLHLVDKLKDFSHRNLVDIGYTGEEEPSYLYRPKANLLLADTPEAWWAAKAEATERFLTDFKNPVTGLPVPGLSGGLKRTQEVFGDIDFISGVSTKLSGDSPASHEIRKFAPNAVLLGMPLGDPKRGIEGYAVSADRFSRGMSPDVTESPELFWQDGFLRLSDVSYSESKPRSTDDDPDALKKAFKGLDRSRVRVIRLEIAGYRRYLKTRPDGSLVVDPMEWLYFHPDDPMIPLNMHAMLTQTDIEASYKREEETLKWLLEEFLPANPGSRFISIHELAAMAEPGPAHVSASQLKDLASSLSEHFAKIPMEPPAYVKGGSNYYSLAETFELLAASLAKMNQTGSLPESVPYAPMYGPYTLPNDSGAGKGSVPVSAVIKTASEIAPRLANSAWKRLPDNSVPEFFEVNSLHLNAAQLLRLMAMAYLDPSPEKMLALGPVAFESQATFMFPKNTATIDQGNSWTFKPAPLRIETPALATPGAP